MQKTRTAVSQLSLLLKHHIIAVTFCLPPSYARWCHRCRRARRASAISAQPLTPTYSKVYATRCYCCQSRDILGYVLSLYYVLVLGLSFSHHRKHNAVILFSFFYLAKNRLKDFRKWTNHYIDMVLQRLK